MYGLTRANDWETKNNSMNYMGRRKPNKKKLDCVRLFFLPISAKWIAYIHLRIADKGIVYSITLDDLLPFFCVLNLDAQRVKEIALHVFHLKSMNIYVQSNVCRNSFDSVILFFSLSCFIRSKRKLCLFLLKF